jgi:Icc protein
MLIAQVTDTHITTDGRQAGDLRAALAWLNLLQPRPDIVLLSGDTTNNGRPDQYARLRAILAGSAIDVVIVPGNHDRWSALRSGLPAAHYPGCIGPSISYAIESAPVRIIGLDTTAPGRPGGVLDDARLRWLDACLSAVPAQPTLLFMHHPPFRTGVHLADMFGFKGLRRFEQIVARHPQLRRIVAGHIHCERRTTIGRALVTTCISSTPQLVPEVFERRLLGLRPEPGGFAIHAFAHGTFTTVTYVQAGAGRFVTRSC